MYTSQQGKGAQTQMSRWGEGVGVGWGEGVGGLGHYMHGMCEHDLALSILICIRIQSEAKTVCVCVGGGGLNPQSAIHRCVYTLGEGMFIHTYMHLRSPLHLPFPDMVLIQFTTWHSIHLTHQTPHLFVPPSNAVLLG